MADDQFGFGKTRFNYGIIVNVKDEDRAGYYQVRIPGDHDGIPDEELPWMRMMTHGASHQKVGRSPTHLIKGSRVVLLHADPAENALIFGAVDTSGLSKKGITKDGRRDIDSQYNSLPNVCYGNNEEVGNCDKNALADGPPPDTYIQKEQSMIKTPVEK